jgi:hypothetical protein
MRSRVFAALAAAVALLLIPAAADAGHRHGHRWVGAHVARHHVYFPRYWYDAEYDPYAYTYAPRRYYPYYNSAYWRPTVELQYRRACCRPYSGLPRYYRAWGYPVSYGVRRWDRHYYRRW